MKNKTKNIAVALVMIIATSLLLYCGFYFTAVTLVGLAYILKEAFWSDHIYYDVKKDQISTFEKAKTYNLKITNQSISLPEEVLDNRCSLFVEIDIATNFAGHLFDPDIAITASGRKIHKQYFEKGAKGKRYINITHSTPVQGSEITLEPSHCRILSTDIKLISYQKPDIEGKKILVISPHPDDAEIAAFGLYSKENSFIVTVSAGEKEAETFASLTQGHTPPEIIKGKLRAHDSIIAPLWAGQTVAGAVNLGYFDDSLKAMFENKKETIEKPYSKTTLPFREFNTIKLNSDKEGTASWSTLIEDLKEILTLFKPKVIITPDLKIDHHIDHQYSTIAIKEAVDSLELQGIEYLFYANHIEKTDAWPFGPSGSLASLPPVNTSYDGILSLENDEQQQIKKSCALEMMHDLRSDKKTKIKIKFRYALQHLLARRPKPYFGTESYYRKNVKSNEIFFFSKSK